MNLYFVLADGRLVTPGADRDPAPGRHPRLDPDPRRATWASSVEERRISTEEWEQGCADGSIAEVFACGTAAVVTPGRRGQARPAAASRWPTASPGR